MTRRTYPRPMMKPNNSRSKLRLALSLRDEEDLLFSSGERKMQGGQPKEDSKVSTLQLAKKHNLGERSIQRLLKIGRSLCPEAISIISGSPAENHLSVLLSMSRTDPESQVTAARILISGVVYFIGFKDDIDGTLSNVIRIGHTYDLHHRIIVLSSCRVMDVEVLGIIMPATLEDEMKLLNEFSEYHIRKSIHKSHMRILDFIRDETRPFDDYLKLLPPKG